MFKNVEISFVVYIDYSCIFFYVIGFLDGLNVFCYEVGVRECCFRVFLFLKNVLCLEEVFF